VQKIKNKTPTTLFSCCLICTDEDNWIPSVSW